MIAVVHDRTLVEGRLQRGQRSAQHHVEARLQTAGIDQPLVGLDRSTVRPRIVDHRQAESSRFAIGKKDLFLELGGADRRNLRRHESLRGVDEDSGWLIAGPADKTASRRIGGRRAEACQVHRAAIDQTGMPVHTRQIHRVVRRRRAQQVVRRPLFIRPVVLIPSAADDPLARPCRGRALADGAHDLLVARGAAQVDALHAGAKAGEVRVRIVQSRHDRRAAGVDHAGGWTATGEHLGIAADNCDPIATDGNRFRGRATRIDDVDAGIVNNQVRGGRGLPQ